MSGTPTTVVAEHLTLRFGPRLLFDQLSFEVEVGELIAVLGPNGSGKTSLLRILLGLLRPSGGSAMVCGVPPAAARSRVATIPQQRPFDPDLPLRALDLVRFGLDGHRYGFGRLGRDGRRRVADALEAVGAAALADAAVGRLSGGEQQRLRVAQALIADPALILADEPLLSLDLAYQRVVVELLDGRRHSHGTPVIFVTHDVNPLLPYVDRVLYLGPGGWAIGAPGDVLTSETLSRLYGTQVDVLRVRDRVVVVGAPDEAHHT